MEQSHTRHRTAKSFRKNYRTGTNKQVMLSGSIDNNKLQRCDVRSMRYFFLARFNNKNTPYRINVWEVETRTQSFIQDATKEESW